MAVSTQQSAIYTETPTRVPVDAGGKYWADDLTWRELPANIVKFNLTCDTVDSLETLVIPSTYQYITSDLFNNGTIINDGKVVLI